MSKSGAIGAWAYLLTPLVGHADEVSYVMDHEGIPSYGNRCCMFSYRGATFETGTGRANSP